MTSIYLRRVIHFDKRLIQFPDDIKDKPVLIGIIFLLACSSRPEYYFYSETEHDNPETNLQTDIIPVFGAFYVGD